MEAKILNRAGPRCLVLSLCLRLCLPGQPAADHPTCSTGGAAFGVDLFGNSLLVKDPDGHILSLKLTPTTKLLQIHVSRMAGGEKSSAIQLGDIQSGDLVCALIEGGAIFQLSVVTRADIEQAQREFVARWQKDSVFGQITSLDVPGQKMAVAPATASETAGPAAVKITRNTHFRHFAKDATRVSEAQTINLRDLRSGDTVYVHGTRTAGDPALQATVVIRGGFRGIIGSFLDARPMNSTVIVHEYGTGKELTMKISSADLYRTTAQLNSPYQLLGPEGPKLAKVGISDFKAGDIVLIVGTADETSSQGTGVLLITRFGSFAAVPDANDQVSWFLK
jgi:hypothetical protein